MPTFQITDCFGEQVTLQPRLGLYSVTDFGGQEMPGLAIILDRLGSTPEETEQYAVLTTSFGEFIGAKDCAYIDTNNCYFAPQLLEQGFAENTGLTKSSGFCQYHCGTSRRISSERLAAKSMSSMPTVFNPICIRVRLGGLNLRKNRRVRWEE